MMFAFGSRNDLRNQIHFDSLKNIINRKNHKIKVIKKQDREEDQGWEGASGWLNPLRLGMGCHPLGIQWGALSGVSSSSTGNPWVRFTSRKVSDTTGLTAGAMGVVNVHIEKSTVGSPMSGKIDSSRYRHPQGGNGFARQNAHEKRAFDPGVWVPASGESLVH